MPQKHHVKPNVGDDEGQPQPSQCCLIPAQ